MPKVINLLNSDKLNINKIDLSKIELKNPLELINFNRLDLIAKILFIKNPENAFYKKIYLENIKALNGFIEDSGKEKNNSESFLNSFLNTFEDIKNNGFNKEKSIIPLGNDGIAIDGAHRIASAYVLQKQIFTIKTTEKSTFYNYNYFLNNGFDKDYLDLLINEYINIKGKNIFCGILWGKAKGKIDNVKEIIKSYNGKLFLSKNIILTENGKTNLVINCYKGEKWLGNRKNGYIGAQKKVDMCFGKNDNNIRVILFEMNTNINEDNLIKLKDDIRNVFNIGKGSIHITDNITETKELSNIFLNANSVDYLNNSIVTNYINLFNIFDKYIKKIGDFNEQYAITGSSVLSLYGIREGNDIDFISTQTDNDINSLIGNHNKYLEKFLDKDVNILLHNPKNFFYYLGKYKVISIDNILQFKENRNEGKDIIDVKLAKGFFDKNKSLKIIIKITILKIKQKLISQILGSLVFVGQKIIPKKFIPFFKKLYYKIIG